MLFNKTIVKSNSYEEGALYQRRDDWWSPKSMSQKLKINQQLIVLSIVSLRLFPTPDTVTVSLFLDNYETRGVEVKVTEYN